MPKTVFFLGNGFSQGLGFPSLSELWHLSFQLSDPWYQQVFQLEECKQQYPVSRFLKAGSEIPDLELLLTVWSAYCEAHELHVPNSNAHESSRGLLEGYIANLCYRLLLHTHQGMKTSAFNDFAAFLKRLTSEQSVGFITTNYDLAIEALASKLSKPYVFLDENHSHDAIPVRKLHGSVAWFLSPSPQPISVPSELGLPARFFEYHEDETGTRSTIYDYSLQCLKNPNTCKLLHLKCVSQIHVSDVAPLTTIIPPVIGKEYGPLFKEVSQYSLMDTAAVDSLVIIGYSLPEADPFIRQLVVDMCKTRGKIFFINSNQEACKQAEKWLHGTAKIISREWEKVIPLLEKVVASSN